VRREVGAIRVGVLDEVCELRCEISMREKAQKVREGTHSPREG
jgi:hypothetical protein